MALTEGLLLALVSMFSWGIADFIVIGPIRGIGNIRTLVIGQAAVFSIMVAYVIAFPGAILFTSRALLFSFLPSLSIILGMLSLYRGFQVGKVSLVAPIVSSWSLVSIAVGFLIFYQAPTFYQMAGALLIISGMFMAIVNVSDIKLSAKKHATGGIPEALASMVFFGFSMAFGKMIVDDVGWLSASFLLYLWQTPMLAFLFFSGKHGKTKPSSGHVLVAGAAGKKIAINKTGNPYMTVGGTGDTLAGICGSLLARGVGAFYAASAAAYINGLAGDMCAKDWGEGLTASKLINYIPKAIMRCI